MVMRKRARHICSTTLVGMWPGESLHSQHHQPGSSPFASPPPSTFPSPVSTPRTSRLESWWTPLSPPCRGHSETPGPGTRGERTAERGGREPLFPGRRKKARHPGAICGRTQASRIGKRRLGDQKRCCSAVVHAPFLRFGDNPCAKKRLWFLEST